MKQDGLRIGKKFNRVWKKGIEELALLEEYIETELEVPQTWEQYQNRKLGAI